MTKRTSARSGKQASVPLPWWTSQSRTSTRSAPSSRRASSAAIATLPKRQKPIARSGSAWWPEGRQALSPTSCSPASSARASSQAPPAAWRAARRLSGPTAVSASIRPPPDSQRSRISPSRRGLWTASIHSSRRGRRLAPLPAEPVALFQRRLDLDDPLRRVGVAGDPGPRVVLEAGGVADVERHRLTLRRESGAALGAPGAVALRAARTNGQRTFHPVGSGGIVERPGHLWEEERD